MLTITRKGPGIFTKVDLRRFPSKKTILLMRFCATSNGIPSGPNFANERRTGNSVARGEWRGEMHNPGPPERVADSPSDALAGRCEPGPVRVGSRRDSSECQARNPPWNRFMDHTIRSATASRAYATLKGTTQKKSSRPSEWNTNELRPLFVRRPIASLPEGECRRLKNRSERRGWQTNSRN